MSNTLLVEFRILILEEDKYRKVQHLAKAKQEYHYEIQELKDAVEMMPISLKDNKVLRQITLSSDSEAYQIERNLTKEKLNTGVNKDDFLNMYLYYLCSKPISDYFFLSPGFSWSVNNFEQMKWIKQLFNDSNELERLGCLIELQNYLYEMFFLDKDVALHVAKVAHNELVNLKSFKLFDKENKEFLINVFKYFIDYQSTSHIMLIQKSL